MLPLMLLQLLQSLNVAIDCEVELKELREATLNFSLTFCLSTVDSLGLSFVSAFIIFYVGIPFLQRMIES